MQQDIKRAKECLVTARHRQKLYADQKRRDVSFSVGDEVLVSTKHIKLKNPGAANKLLPCWIGPYRITALVGKVAVKIDFPQHYKIHNVFHVSLMNE